MNRGDFWGPIPVYVLRDHRHKAGHIRVLGAILSCPQPYFPSLEEISQRSGHTPSYCSKMISEMVKIGTLEREQRYNDTKRVSTEFCVHNRGRVYQHGRV